MITRAGRVAAAMAVSAGLALGGASAAQAQSTTTPTAAFCSGETLVSYKLKNGARWEMCWGTHSLKGLVLSKVSFQGPKDDAPKMILDAINTVQMNVPYDNGNIEYDDVLQYGFGGNYLKGLDPTECPKGELREATVSWETSTSVYREEDRPVLCIREADTGTAYRSQYRSGGAILAKQGTDLIVSATAAIGNYEYEQRYSFHDDGQIDADLGATGEAIPFGADYSNGWPVGKGETDFLMNHYHSAVWRVDFGLDAQSQMKAEQWDTAPTGQRGPQSAIYKSTKTDLPQEKLLNLANRRWFRILAPNSKNADDHPRSYEFVYGKNDPYSSYPHLKYELGLTQFRSCEQFPMRNMTAVAGCGDKTTVDYVNGENLTNPVAWVNVGFHHVPRDEDQSPMPIHWQGFSLYPRDWHANNSQAPALREAWNGRTMPPAPAPAPAPTPPSTTTTPPPTTTTPPVTPTTTTPSTGTSSGDTLPAPPAELPGGGTPPPVATATPADDAPPPASAAPQPSDTAAPVASSGKAGKTRSKTTVRVKRRKVTVAVKAAGGVASGKVAIKVNGRTVKVVALKRGKANLTLPKLKPGTYKVSARYIGSAAASASSSPAATVKVTR